MVSEGVMVWGKIDIRQTSFGVCSSCKPCHLCQSLLQECRQVLFCASFPFHVLRFAFSYPFLPLLTFLFLLPINLPCHPFPLLLVPSFCIPPKHYILSLHSLLSHTVFHVLDSFLIFDSIFLYSFHIFHLTNIPFHLYLC